MVSSASKLPKQLNRRPSRRSAPPSDLINRPFESAFAQHTYLFRKGTFLSVKLFGTLAFFWRRMRRQTAQSQQLSA
jgi:hypothetical protein